MCEISSTIRAKPRWWEKMHDTAITTKWLQEVREQEEERELPHWSRLTDNMASIRFSILLSF
jgi:hypothetical protein